MGNGPPVKGRKQCPAKGQVVRKVELFGMLPGPCKYYTTQYEYM